jgi:hypothetical protein
MVKLIRRARDRKTDADVYGSLVPVCRFAGLMGDREASLGALDRIKADFHDSPRAPICWPVGTPAGVYRKKPWRCSTGQWVRVFTVCSTWSGIMKRAEEQRREAMSAFIAERGDQLLELSIR